MVHLRVRRWSRVAPPCCAPGAVADFLFLNSLLLAVLGQLVGFVGATVTGIGLRRRKRELKVLNTTLLSINAELRTAQRRDRRAGRVRVNTTKEGAVDAKAEGACHKVVDRLRAEEQKATVLAQIVEGIAIDAPQVEAHLLRARCTAETILGAQ